MSVRAVSARCNRPLADDPVRKPPERDEDEHTEGTRQDHRRKEHFALESSGVALQELSDSDCALPEEEVADDGADHGETRRDPQTGEDTPEGPPRKSWIDNVIPDAMGDRATGMGSLLSVIPGTTARDLSADVDTLISEIITSEVAKLKAAGVSFGQITEYENKMFAKLQGSLDLGQGREQVIRNIRVLDEAMRRAAETGQPLLENDPALAAITGPAPDTATMQTPAPGGLDPEAEALMEQYAPKR